MSDDWKWEEKIAPVKDLEGRIIQLATKRTYINLAELALAAQRLCPPPIKKLTAAQSKLLRKLGQEVRFILPTLICDYFDLLAENGALKKELGK